MSRSKNDPSNPPLKAHEAIEKLLATYQFRTVLDVGCGPGRHSDIFRRHGKSVAGIDIAKMCDDVIVADFLRHSFDRQFDCLWLSHVLEHQINVNAFLKKAFADLKPGGILAVTVPPLKHQIVGGHVTLWNAGLLLYNLILAGFDCRQARVKHYGYNISVLVPKVPADVLYERLHFDRGDIEILSQFFPEHVRMKWEHSFRGDIAQLNWDGGELLFDQPRSKSVMRFLSPGYWRKKRAA